MIYSVINIDMVNSRKLSQRLTIQDELLEMVDDFNKEYTSLLLSPMTLTLGDEWQAVLKKPEKTYFIIDQLQQVFKKAHINIYAGVGIGEISTAIYSDTRKMDGECFILAREAIKIVKNKNVFYNDYIHSKKNRVFFNAKPVMVNNRYDTFSEIAATRIDETTSIDDTTPITLMNIINNLVENNEVLKSKITAKQQDIITLYKQHNSYNKIMKFNKNTSKASISQKLNDAHYFVIKNNDDMIESMIGLYIRLREEICNE
ncbi:hypothetical protein HZI73_26030 [Vallitalea pronyensis]|uniref:SatD family (SatD) n=1 Tax=Vallitalea pronyensis TaxID=1348613 RepID=A0A8J8SJ29_9FIRM|nr:SatD family protein [Vallitalea pronyensis]QUI25540.1 hypothetical protein HZI73_26030 [Vallitalea pronyensis]